MGEVIDSSIFYEGSWERASMDTLKRLVAPGDFIVDVGANMGVFSLSLGRLVTDRGRVIAFEPMSHACHRLRKNLELNPDLKKVVHLETVALSNESASENQAFVTSWRFSGASDSKPASEIVETLTLDSYFEKNPTERVDWLKVDVDGFEFKVIKGAHKTLKKFHPKICLELGSYTLQRVGDRLEDLLEFLIGLDYKFYLADSLQEIAASTLVSGLIPDGETINIFCLKESPKN